MVVILGMFLSFLTLENFIFQVLKRLETLIRITIKCTLKARLIVILEGVFNISNTLKVLSFKYQKDYKYFQKSLSNTLLF